MCTRISIHNVEKITREDSGILNRHGTDGGKYKHITLSVTDKDGHLFEISLFSDDISLGIEGVTS